MCMAGNGIVSLSNRGKPEVREASVTVTVNKDIGLTQDQKSRG